MVPITTKAEAERAIDEVTALVDKLAGLLARETALVQAGQIRSVAEIAPIKQQLVGQLLAFGERLKANAKIILQSAPAHAGTLQPVQDAFRAVVQKNMMVLATAHAVSEGIVRRLSGELARKAAPQVYGASGRATAPNPKHGRPLAISRSL
jgi:hypothetical protein